MLVRNPRPLAIHETIRAAEWRSAPVWALTSINFSKRAVLRFGYQFEGNSNKKLAKPLKSGREKIKCS